MRRKSCRGLGCDGLEAITAARALGGLEHMHGLATEENVEGTSLAASNMATTDTRITEPHILSKILLFRQPTY